MCAIGFDTASSKAEIADVPEGRSFERGGSSLAANLGNNTGRGIHTGAGSGTSVTDPANRRDSLAHWAKGSEGCRSEVLNTSITTFERNPRLKEADGASAAVNVKEMVPVARSPASAGANLCEWGARGGCRGGGAGPAEARGEVSVEAGISEGGKPARNARNRGLARSCVNAVAAGFSANGIEPGMLA
jgi:hypothetical protein